MRPSRRSAVCAAVIGLSVSLASSARLLDPASSTALRETHVVEFAEGDPLKDAPGRRILHYAHNVYLNPRAIVVCVGDSIEFKNNWIGQVNVFSYSETHRFDLGRFRPGESRTAGPFPRAGLVRIYDEIHANVKGFILVVDCSGDRDRALEAGAAELRALRIREDQLHLEQEEQKRSDRKLWDALDKNVGASTEVARGLQTTTFDTINGQVVVNLPDDAGAGDTISGTVSVIPKGPSDAEKARQREALEATVLLLPERRVRVGDGAFTWTLPTPGTTETVQVSVRLIEVTHDGRDIGAAIVPMEPPVEGGGFRGTPGPPDFHCPTLGQEGRANEVSGPFDGRFDTTTLTLFGRELKLLAESPRKLIFETPRDVAGLTRLTLKERGVSTGSEYRVVKVILTALKSNLLKGERTLLTVIVDGLAGILEDVPLQLAKSGVVRMEGGDAQTVQIRPAEAQGGRYTTTRSVTGTRAGGFTVSATVIARPFDTCLQDDHNGNALLLNSMTGDYQFCSLGTGVSVAGRGQFSKTANASTVIDKTSDRRTQIMFNPLVRRATATVKVAGPNRTFTIADTDRRNSACSCQR